MIRSLIDFALRNRFLVLSLAILLFVWGAISFHNLPIEAYPDVADTYAQVITQWPGHAAEAATPAVLASIEPARRGTLTAQRTASNSSVMPLLAGGLATAPLDCTYLG